jgi:hypothetical protein
LKLLPTQFFLPYEQDFPTEIARKQVFLLLELENPAHMAGKIELEVISSHFGRNVFSVYAKSMKIQRIYNVFHIVNKVENVCEFQYILDLIDNVEYVVYALYSSIFLRNLNKNYMEWPILFI